MQSIRKKIFPSTRPTNLTTSTTRHATFSPPSRAHQFPAPTPRARTQLIHTPPNNHRSLQRQKHLCNGENAQRGTRSAIRLCCDDCDTLASGVATSKGRFEDSLRDDSQVNETKKNIANFFFFLCFPEVLFLRLLFKR